jgi:hypothetical protein
LPRSLLGYPGRNRAGRRRHAHADQPAASPHASCPAARRSPNLQRADLQWPNLQWPNLQWQRADRKAAMEMGEVDAVMERAKRAGAHAFDRLVYVLDRFGLPTVLLLGLAWYVHRDILKPLTQTHIQFVGSTAEAVAKIAEAERSQAATLEQMSRIMADQDRRLDEFKATLGRPVTHATTPPTRPPGT